MTLTYRRALLKLSGEALAGDRGFGLDFGVVDRLSDEVKAVRESGADLGLVIGGGNIMRGNQASKQARRPNPSPQWTSRPGKLPSMLSSPIGSVDGLFRLAGSRSGPSTMWFRSAMAM